MKPLFYFFFLISASATAQIQWAQFSLPPLQYGVTTIAHDVKFDQHGNAFIPLDGAGIIVYNGTPQILYNGDNVPLLAGRDITAVEIDQNNVKWFLDGNNLNLITYNDTAWTLVPQSISLVDAQGFTLKFDGAGNLWCAASSLLYNIAKFDGNGWTFYSSMMQIGNYNWFLPLKMDNLGKLVWCDGSFFHWFDGVNSDSAGLGSSLLGWGGEVSDFEIDSNGEVWAMVVNTVFGSEKLAHYNGISWAVETLPSYWEGYRTRVMLDNEGTFWIPASNTLWKKSNGNWQNVFNNGVFFSTDIAIDPQQRMWFYTTDSIEDYPENNFISILDQNGFNTINGNVYFDLNANGIKDAGEPPYKNQYIQLEPLGYYQITDDSGNYQFGLIDTAGTYDVTLLPAPNWYISSSPQSYSVTQSSNLEITPGINFGIAPTSSYDDAVAGASWGITKKGWETYFTISVYNNGTTLMSGTMELTFDSHLQYVSAGVTPDVINGNVLTWNYFGLFPGESKSFLVQCHVPGNLNVGDQLTSSFLVTPLLTDADQSNNTITLESIVKSAYDPNIKTVYPAGEGNDGVIAPGTTLFYTIQFQNTGNDTAHHVTLYDVLDADLNILTLQVIGTSHPYTIQIIENHTLQIDFPNIMLPDSGTNQIASHGFIQYRIIPDPGCALGTSILNGASIVFDDNAPVETNNTYNLIGEPTMVSPVPESVNSIEIIPNPFITFAIISFSVLQNGNVTLDLYDLSGRRIKTLLNENLEEGNHSINFQANQLASGIYFLQLKTGNKMETEKMVIE